MKQSKIFEGNRMKFYLEDFRNILPLKNIQTVIVDPPYNINFNYGKNFKDFIDPEDYKQLIYEVAYLSYKSTKRDLRFVYKCGYQKYHNINLPLEFLYP